MVKTKIVELNGVSYMKSYSDAGKFIKRNNQAYFEAIDPVDSQREYEETDISIEEDTPYEINRLIAEEIQKLGGLSHKITPSDKIGFDWDDTYIGDILVKREYLEHNIDA